jgi:hypothetical protein
MLKILETVWLKKTGKENPDDGWKLKYDRMKNVGFIVITEPLEDSKLSHKVLKISSLKKKGSGRVSFDSQIQQESFLTELMVELVLEQVDLNKRYSRKYLNIAIGSAEVK